MDVTGFQTLNPHYQAAHAPLVTMSQWGWHTTPVSPEKKAYAPSDLQQTEYDYAGRKVYYPVKRTPKDIYNWLRENPHKTNLLEISLLHNGVRVLPDDLSDIHQRLELACGIVTSQYTIAKQVYRVKTVCHHESDTLAFSVEGAAFGDGSATLALYFPYGASNHEAMTDDTGHRHETTLVSEKQLHCQMDDDAYYVTINGDGQLVETAPNHYELHFSAPDAQFTISFAKDHQPAAHDYADVIGDTLISWQKFWKTTGFVDFTKSKHPKAHELERRIILSQYLMAIQDAGSIPPQETGLLSSSWYGKPHLEMHLWHGAFMPLWHRPQDLEKSFGWYLKHQPEARENAARNGYAGLRWQKMVGPDGIDSPSPIAPLIIWQQCHIIYMLELVYQQTPSDEFLKKYWPLVKGTADFMQDFVVYNQSKGVYELVAPIFPSQERFDPTKVLNPTFEIEYWRFGLRLAEIWAKRLDQDASGWRDVADHMAESRIYQGVYLSHANCPETFDSVAIDHPSQTGIFGLIPNDRIDRKAFSATLDKVLEKWDFNTLWGWDFGMMSMGATRIGRPQLAMDFLLSDTPKNQYEKNGHNRQAFRNDLPGYLPGNGSLLLAVALMVAGFPGSKPHPGLPDDGQWEVEYENISAFPY